MKSEWKNDFCTPLFLYSITLLFLLSAKSTLKKKKENVDMKKKNVKINSTGADMHLIWEREEKFFSAGWVPHGARLAHLDRPFRFLHGSNLEGERVGFNLDYPTHFWMAQMRQARPLGTHPVPKNFTRTRSSTPYYTN